MAEFINMATRDAGALEITRATESYPLVKQVWFQQGAEFYYQDYPGVIEAEGESGWMNHAPQAWLADPACETRELLYVAHMAIFENVEALDFLVTSARAVSLGIDSCP